MPATRGVYKNAAKPLGYTWRKTYLSINIQETLNTHAVNYRKQYSNIENHLHINLHKFIANWGMNL